jgi:hypothetical protein
MTKREPEQFTLDREDKLRIDLQGKIDKLNDKHDPMNDRLTRIETKMEIDKPGRTKL